MADAIPMGRKRRDFWSKFYFKRGPLAWNRGGKSAVATELDFLLNEVLASDPGQGHVWLVGAGPGDPELLTLKARNLLHEADVVIHDHRVAKPILELARREAVLIETGQKAFGAPWQQSQINALLLKHATRGHQVVRLKSGNIIETAETEALTSAGLAFGVVPGIPAISDARTTVNPHDVEQA